MSPELINVIFQVSRWLFAFLGVFSVLSALGWLHAEKKVRRDRLRAAPAAGTIGELMVLSGSDELPAQTWFPVTREGVLGSVRSCDLVVPCPGVRAHHLDYTWKDGVGLIIHPRSGCEAFIDGIRLDCRSDVLSCPLTHGACLRVGDAILRLQVFKALNMAYGVPADFPEQSGSIPPEEIIPFPAVEPGLYSPSETGQPYFDPGAPAVPPVDMMQPAVPPADLIPPAAIPSQVPYDSVPDTPAASRAPARRRSDTWKEDWSE